MFQAIRRVISDSEDVGKSHKKAKTTMNSAEPSPMEGVQTTSGLAASPGSHLVEPDHSVRIPAPLKMVHSTGQSDHYASNSSLSDSSDPGSREGEEDALVPSITHPPPKPEQKEQKIVPQTLQRVAVLNRMDSAADGSSSGSQRASSQNSSRDWGWFEDVHQASDGINSNEKRDIKKMMPPSQATNMAPPENTHVDNSMAVTAPPYVLEESLSSQRLWKDTAGTRPPQPVEERAFFEKMWAQNFARSQVDYQMPVEVLTATSPVALSPFADGVFEGTSGDSVLGNYSMPGDQDHDAAEAALSQLGGINNDGGDPNAKQKIRGSGSDGDLTVILRGPNAFGTTVSKSFARNTVPGGPVVVDTVNISIASYRVVESRKYGKYAQFLVIYRQGSIRDTVGVWKRYRHFEQLANKVTHAHEGCAAAIANMSPLHITEESETEHLPNAITSWRLLKKRKRWYRCLDAGYLSLKVFLLERFLHDILFESSSPQLLRDFVLGNVE
uniref:PX domain-containing protein n=1 Tax=Amphora coffeiformis TaxID=265554 RepID=A0A7S3PDZ6_9STRA